MMKWVRNIIFLYVWMFCLYACTCTACMPVGFPRTGVTDVCEHHMGAKNWTHVFCKLCHEPTDQYIPRVDMIHSQLGEAYLSIVIVLVPCWGWGDDPIGGSERHPLWDSPFLPTPGCVEARRRQIESEHSRSVHQKTSTEDWLSFH